MGQVEAALKLANILKGEGSKATVFNKVAAKRVELGQLEQALQIASSKGGSHTYLSESEKDNLLAEIANQFARKGQQSQALKVAESIVNSELKAKEITAIATIVKGGR